MMPEVALYLDKARDRLQQAEFMIGVAFDEAAGRAAYITGFHAAQGFPLETTGEVPAAAQTFHLGEKLRGWMPVPADDIAVAGR